MGKCQCSRRYDQQKTVGTNIYNRVDYSVVDPTKKWKILKTQSRFALWGTHKCSPRPGLLGLTTTIH
jgi:hypothetical protein